MFIVQTESYQRKHLKADHNVIQQYSSLDGIRRQYWQTIVNLWSLYEFIFRKHNLMYVDDAVEIRY